MPATVLPPPGAVQDILLWHQGALGDLLLAGGALVAVSRHYSQARLTGVGHPERWGLMAQTLPLASVWDGGEACWAHLYGDSPLPPSLLERLAPFQMALVFSPRPRPEVLDRLRQAGIAAVHWLPAFLEDSREAVVDLQARHLAEWGIPREDRPFRLVLKESSGQSGGWPELDGAGPWVVVAPGSGHPVKNWPLSHYYEVTRALAWQHGAQVLWLAGPAEETWLPYLEALAAAQGHRVLSGLSLARVAAVLSRCRLYLGGDSGLTHLAAAAGARWVLTLFGPTDPRVWAPAGEQVRVLRGCCPKAPCAAGREIPCTEPRCLQDLAPETVLAAAAALLDRG